MNDVQVAVRLPRALADALDARAAKVGAKRSDVLRDLLALALAGPGTVEGELRALRREVERLRQSIEGRKS